MKVNTEIAKKYYEHTRNYKILLRTLNNNIPRKYILNIFGLGFLTKDQNKIQ